jgi:Zn-dependent M28 family amino/carboxypeptidase
MRRILISSSLLALSLTLFVSVRAADTPPSKAKPAKVVATAAPGYGNAESITEEEMKIYLYFLASDQLEGRNLPSRGYDTAALYVASHLAEWGLKPGGSTANTNGPLQPYFMPLEMVSKQVVPEESKASITAPAGRGARGGGGGGGAGAAGGGGARGGANVPAGPTELAYSKDWTVVAGGRGGPPLAPLEVTGNLVFAGNGYVINKTKVNPYEGLDVRGKIIVVAGLPAELAALQAAGGGGRGGRGRAGAAGTGAGTPPETGGAANPAEAGAQPAAAAGGGGRGAAVNPLGETCKDFLTPEEFGAKNGALAVVTIANFQQLTAMANPNAGGGFGGGGGGGGRGGLNGPAYQVPKLQQPPACPSVPAITAGLAMTNAIFNGEKMSASQIFYAAGASAKQDSFELTAEKKLSLKVTVHTEQNHGENVIGILEGSDPVLKNEFIVMSAHLDHIGLAAPLPDGHNVNNGADDDGSGSAGLLAVARSYAEGAAKGIRPKRSIIFLWNAGEEKGLWGSQYFTEYPPVDITKVVANLNMDMIGRTKGPGYTDPDRTHVLVNPGEVLVVGPNISSDDMEKTIETVNGSYQKLSLNHFYDTTAPDATHDNLGPQPNGQRVFYRSDHYNFAKMGIPVAFFTVGLHPDYHRATDTPDKIDYKEMQVISKTVAAVGWVLGSQAGRPQLKTNLPEQLLKDMKTVKDQGWGKTTPVLPPLAGEPY